MDLFNPMSWVDRDARYTSWNSVYPPLNFLLLDILKILSGISVYENDPYTLRSQTLLPQLLFCFFYLLSPIVILSMRYYAGFTTTTKLLIYIIFITGIPALFALERGNLILIALPFVALSLSLRPSARIIAFAVLVNLKPYFIVLGLLLLIRKYFTEALVGILLSGLLFLITGFILQDNYFISIFNNIFIFGKQSADSYLELFDLRFNLLGFSIRNIVSLFDLMNIQYLSATYVHKFFYINYIFIFSIIILVFLKRNALSIPQVYTVLYIALLNVTGSIGGYSLIIYFCLLPILAEFKFSKLYFTSLFLINAPIDFLYSFADVVFDFSYSSVYRIVYLSGERADIIHANIGLGVLIRPALNGLILFFLLIELARINQQTK